MRKQRLIGQVIEDAHLPQAMSELLHVLGHLAGLFQLEI